MAEKKAVLNVTVAESLADAVRHDAAARGATISSVVEAALAAHIKRELKRAEGLAAIREEYEQAGYYPTPEEEAAAKAAVAQERRLLAEALAADARDAQRQATGAA
jgi:Ribbon-helix-helix protein, copG family